MSLKNNKLKVGVSIGDPNGIGIEVILKTLQRKEILDFFTPVIFGSTKLMSYQKNIFGFNSLYFQGISKVKEAVYGKINVVNLWKENSVISFGEQTEESKQMAKTSYNAAIESLKEGSIDFLVSAPMGNCMGEDHELLGFLKKQLGGFPFYLLENEGLRISFINKDAALMDISKNLKKEEISSQLRKLNKTLIQDFCIEKPKIAVLGINLFSEDINLLGKEELQIIEPAIKDCFERGLLAFGPYSADNFFTESIYTAFDAVLAINQEQIIDQFKTIVYENGAGFIGGMPFIYLEPLNDVGYSIAGKGEASHVSFEQAIFDGIKIFNTRKEYLELKINSLKKVKIDGIDMSLDEDLPDEEEG